jgi:hypothetical protein
MRWFQLSLLTQAERIHVQVLHGFSAGALLA